MDSPMNRTCDYKPARWNRFDNDGNPMPVVVYASRSYTEWREPTGRIHVERHKPVMHRREQR